MNRILLALAICIATAANAQHYPTKPIRIIVAVADPYAAELQQELITLLGAPVRLQVAAGQGFGYGFGLDVWIS